MTLNIFFYIDLPVSRIHDMHAGNMSLFVLGICPFKKSGLNNIYLRQKAFVKKGKEIRMSPSKERKHEYLMYTTLVT